ncbi:hypothetical protein VKT23_002790 [Stygiomarasmius scandens]|uniref:Uncharacterized protein n=1 Tax=Marasmiellus scandens TaxID=2682957 RepID=A0ABR1JVT1_9AGAR
MSFPAVLSLLVLYVTNIGAVALEPRAGPQSEATCDAGFDWANNRGGLSPCLLAAMTIAPCSQTGAWNIPKLTIGNHYNGPNSTTNTDCYCSWAAYNLLNACTACQNLDDSITTWPSFSAQCGPHLSNTTYFPSGMALSSNASLPFYATINPTSWLNQKFDVDQAKSEASSGQPDVNPSATNANSPSGSPTQSSSSNSKPTGAIAGGVVGGVVGLVIVGLVAFWCVRRRRRPTSEDGVAIVRPAHGRSVSDLTQSTYPQTSPSPYAPIPSPPISFGIQTHESGPATVSRFGSIYTTAPHGNSPSRAMSPAPSMDPSLRMSVTSQNQSIFQPMAMNLSPNAEDIVRPFVVAEPTVVTAPQENLGRKGGFSSQFDQPNSPPVVRTDDSETDPSGPRINPPAYTPYPAASEATTPSEEVAADRRERNGHGHRPTRDEKGSFDTNSPWTSTGSRVITTATPPRSGPSTTQMTTAASPRHVVNTTASVISGPDDEPDIA